MDEDRKIVAALKTLHTRIVDASDGFDVMLEKAETEFQPLVRSFHDIHADHATRVAKLIEVAGDSPDHDGSVMGKVNTLVVSLRALVDEIDEDVLPQVLDGEEHVLQAFDDALRNAQTGHQNQALTAMKSELDNLLRLARQRMA